jgi:transcription elongation factor GreB
MTRWRAPAKPSSPYITAAGYRQLEAEMVAIWKRRREVVKHLAAAAAEGDRSENAEYIYRKKELGGIDRRIRYLQRRMPTLNIISRLQCDQACAFFGASVEVEHDNGTCTTYRIVGSDETDGARGWISVDSPVAKALLTHAVDDEITVATGAGSNTYVIVAISYLDPTADLTPP